MQWTGKENTTGDSSLPKASEKEFLSNLEACSMRSDSGARREGREREKNEEKQLSYCHGQRLVNVLLTKIMITENGKF